LEQDVFPVRSRELAVAVQPKGAIKMYPAKNEISPTRGGQNNLG
jgi:hypothetical protein